jgi:UDP-N-acetylmuramoylalanine--D-glutamate ligase
MLKNKRVLVVGLGKSGLAASQLLTSQGARVFISDQKSKKELRDFIRQLPKGVNLETAGQNFLNDSYDLIVLSPGVSSHHPKIKKALEKKTEVWSELELGWRFVKPFKTIAITGTNGKTTTTALIGHILKKVGKPTIVGGNIGTPLCSLVRKIHSRHYLVLEVSSYQLERHQTFHPNVGLFLNLTPDHLARHGSMSGYANAKLRLFKNMTPKDFSVLNRTDRWCKKIAPQIHAKKIWFPSPSLQKIGQTIKLPGEHNIQNAMAAAAALQSVGIKTSDIIRGIKTFKGVDHRIQFVRTLNGVDYFNDSKATNVDSTLVALKAFSKKIILILGGEDKGAPYTPLIPLINEKVRTILTIGEAAPLIRKDLKVSLPLLDCKTLNRAVSLARKLAFRGDVVLLSPACASFDQFKNFEHRGEMYSRLVRSLN